MIKTRPDSSQNAIDSRDVIEAISDLESELEDDNLDAGEKQDLQQELSALKALEAAANYGDWPYGATLIRDSYFQTYAEEMAEEIGAIDPNAGWPLTYIDWERAADALKQDYTEVEFDGVSYWIRA